MKKTLSNAQFLKNGNKMFSPTPIGSGGVTPGG